MITKRHLYGPIERIESATERLVSLAKDAEVNGDVMVCEKIREIIARDLSKAHASLEYIMEIAEW